MASVRTGNENNVTKRKLYRPSENLSGGNLKDFMGSRGLHAFKDYTASMKYAKDREREKAERAKKAKKAKKAKEAAAADENLSGGNLKLWTAQYDNMKMVAKPASPPRSLSLKKKREEVERAKEAEEKEFYILPVEDYEPEFTGGNAFHHHALAAQFPEPDLETLEQYPSSVYELGCEYDDECHGEASFKPVVDRMLQLNGIGPLPKSVNDKIVGCGLDHHHRVCNHALPMAVYKHACSELQKDGVDFRPREVMAHIKSEEVQRSPDYRRVHAQLRRALNRASLNLDEGRDILDGIDDMVGGNIFKSIVKGVKKGVTTIGEGVVTAGKEVGKVGRKIGEGVAKVAVGAYDGVKFATKEALKAAEKLGKNVAPVVWNQVKNIGEKGIVAAGKILETQGPMVLTSLLGAKGMIAGQILTSILGSGGDPADPQTQAAAYEAAATFVEKNYGPKPGVKPKPGEVDFLTEALNKELSEMFENAEIEEIEKAA